MASRIPTQYRVNGNETKIALRGAAVHRIGEENAKREKLGFPVPVSGRRDNWRQIWCVYMFLVWYQVYFTNPFY